MSATTNQAATVASEKVRGILAELADAICASTPTVVLSTQGSTIHIHIEDLTLNISLSDAKGGAA